MITLDAKMTRTQNMLEDKNSIALVMPAYMDLRGFISISDLKDALENSAEEVSMFYKFASGVFVSLVCNKAKEFEAGYEAGWK